MHSYLNQISNPSWILSELDLFKEHHKPIVHKVLQELESQLSFLSNQKGLALLSEQELIACSSYYAHVKGKNLPNGLPLANWLEHFDKKETKGSASQVIKKMLSSMDDGYNHHADDSLEVVVYYDALQNKRRIIYEERIRKVNWGQEKPKQLLLSSVEQLVHDHFRRGIHIHILINQKSKEYRFLPYSFQSFSELETLTHMEKKVLQAFVEYHDKDEMIADKICISINTLKSHKQHIVQKLHMGSFAHVVAFFQNEMLG